MYNINLDNIIDQYLAPPLNKPIIRSIVRVISWPIRYIISSFVLLIDTISDKLSYNAQVCSLERLLNLKFPDPGGDMIYITDAANIPMLAAYNYQDSNHLIIVTNAANFNNYQVIAYCENQIGDNLNKFVINIPDSNEARNNESQLVALVNRYKFSGKTFILRYI